LKILAIDPSLNQTGLCFPDQTTMVLKPPSGSTGPSRLAWIRDMLAGILSGNPLNGVVIEDYPLGAKGQSVFQLAELGGVIRLLLHELSLPVAFVNPSTLKAWVGAAKKDQIMAIVTHRTGRLFATSDEADAWALGAMAAQSLGRAWIEMPAAQSKFVGRVRWPWAVA